MVQRGTGGALQWPQGVQPDPHPDIPATLLNAEQITTYAQAPVSMLQPFHPEDDRLKIASYSIHVGQIYRIAREGFRGQRYEWAEYQVPRDGEIVLEPNALIYVGLDTDIQLPHYIAARFNLAIKHVYRGLIAGTGPLVDPGYRGKLFIPLHNLSSVAYHLRPGERLIWMEFTKLHVDQRFLDWLTDPRHSHTTMAKSAWQLGQFLHHASNTTAISSSLTPLKKESQDAKRIAERTHRRVASFGVGAAIAIVAALAAIIIQGFQLVHDVQDQVQQLERESSRVTSSQQDP